MLQLEFYSFSNKKALENVSFNNSKTYKRTNKYYNFPI